MSVSNPLVTPIHNGTTCFNIVNVLQNGCIWVLKDIVDVKQLLEKKLQALLEEATSLPYYNNSWHFNRYEQEKYHYKLI